MSIESLPHARTKRRLCTLGLLLIGAVGAVQLQLMAAPAFHPASYGSGALPQLPPVTVVGGGQVMLELDVTSGGAVRGAKTLRTTPPFTDLLIAATKTWQFTPAEVEIEPAPPPGQPRFRAIDSTVLVAAVFNAPTLIGPTLGDLPRDVGTEADSTPFPFAITPPLFPPRARDSGAVMIETTIDLSGQPTENRVVQSSAAFDEAALMALRQWRFRPARIGGSATRTLAYVIIGFRQPVSGGAAGGAAPPGRSGPGARLVSTPG
jgi:TonB family protein